MKKMLILIAVLILLVGCGKEEEVKYTHMDRMSLEGDVVFVKTRVLSAFSGKPEQFGLQNFIYPIIGNTDIEFDEMGNFKTVAFYNKNELKLREYQYFYNEENEVMHYVEVLQAIYGNEEVKLLHNYGEKTIVDEFKTTQDYEVVFENVLSQYKITYNKEYNSILFDQIDEDGFVMDYELFHNEDGTLRKYTMEMIDYDNNQHTSEMKGVIINNDYGDYELITEEGVSGNVEYRFEYKYDDQMNWTEMTILLYGDPKWKVVREITYR